MNETTRALLLMCGVCCIWPAIVAALSVLAYRRYQIGGWRAVFFGNNNDKSLS